MWCVSTDANLAAINHRLYSAVAHLSSYTIHSVSHELRRVRDIDPNPVAFGLRRQFEKRVVFVCHLHANHCKGTKTETGQVRSGHELDLLQQLSRRGYDTVVFGEAQQRACRSRQRVAVDGSV